MSKTILVTGANGSICSHLIPQLRKAGANVRAVVRDQAKAAPLQKLGCEVVVHDLNKPVPADLYKGVDAAFLLTAPGQQAAKQMSNLIQGAKGTQVHVVRLSALKAAEDAPTENGRLHFKSDKELTHANLKYTILRPHFFMQNLLWSMDSVQKEGKLYMGMGTAKLGMIDARDVADCAARILLDGSHVGKIFTPTGPKAVRLGDVAGALSSAVGHKVTYVAGPLESVRESVVGMTGDAWLGQMMADYSKAYGEGWGDFTTDDVFNIVGKEARSIEAFCKEVVKPIAQHVEH